MTRREIREQVFILLFQREFYGREPFDEQKETYMETKEWTEKDQAYIEEHMAKIMDKPVSYTHLRKGFSSINTLNSSRVKG